MQRSTVQIDRPAQLAALTDLLPADVVDASPVALAAAGADRSGWRSEETALAVVRARHRDDVVVACRFATEHRIPIVPRGAGTGLAGGAIAAEGALVIDVSRMREVVRIDAADGVAVVQPGILNGELDSVLAEHGLWWPPDPASREIASVGGNIATNAGGLLCVKYGVTREWVLGLEVVLADGRVLRTGRGTVKGVTGLDLTALVTGSEGTLGVVTEATLKVRRPVAGPVATIGATFVTVEEAAAAAAAITAAGLTTAALELLDERSCIAITEHFSALGEPIDAVDLAGRGAFLLVQCDGPGAEADGRAALEAVRSIGGDASLTLDAAEGERLLAIRRAAHPAYARLGEVLIEDVCVPRSALPTMVRAIERIAEDTGLVIPVVAHAGDGNLHPNVVVPAALVAADGTIPDVVWAAADRIFREAVALGGTLTGEHGVGVLKRRWIGEELGDLSLELHAGIKAVFDPLGIMNPGRAY